MFALLLLLQHIFDCIRKFLQFQITVIVVVSSMTFLGTPFLTDSPLTPVKMFGIYLIMNILKLHSDSGLDEGTQMVLVSYGDDISS